MASKKNKKGKRKSKKSVQVNACPKGEVSQKKESEALTRRKNKKQKSKDSVPVNASPNGEISQKDESESKNCNFSKSKKMNGRWTGSINNDEDSTSCIRTLCLCILRVCKTAIWPFTICCYAITCVCAGCWSRLNNFMSKFKNGKSYRKLPTDPEEGDVSEVDNAQGETIVRLNNEIAKLNVRLQESDKTITKLRKEHQKTEKSDKAQGEIVRLKNEITSLNKRLQDNDKKSKELGNDYQKTRTSLQKSHELLQKERRTNQERLKQTEQMLEQERRNHKERLQQSSSLEQERNNLLERLKRSDDVINALKQEKAEALNRLSLLMGDKLRENNPAITNLNDPNRPMKLGDQFSELYENEWTDAFVDLSETNSMTEKDTIDVLINILKEISLKCKEEVEIQLLEAKKSMCMADNADDGSLSKWKDTLKSNASKYIPQLTPKVTNCGDCKTTITFKETCLPYIQKCVRVCYYAELQDPPMFMDYEPGKEFDRQCFKEYTKSGTIVDYLVWPAFYLHKDGPLMAKGVVQPQEIVT